MLPSLSLSWRALPVVSPLLVLSWPQGLLVLPSLLLLASLAVGAVVVVIVDGINVFVVVATSVARSLSLQGLVTPPVVMFASIFCPHHGCNT
jgi:hypothetical protein